MREIINQTQADILAILEVTVDAKHDDITGKLCTSRRAYDVAMTDLRERGLVFGTKEGSKNVLRLSITMAGIRALHDHIKHQEQLKINPTAAMPARINLFKLPVYKPSANVYCRNNGNRHIRSLGAFA